MIHAAGFEIAGNKVLPPISFVNPLHGPLVSIGVPIYNEEKYLPEMLNSLLGQDFQDFELIISDNASDDGTSDICKAYVARDQRIHYHRNERNIGSVGNFNQAFELASGEYFMWASGHDLWEPSFISRCLEVLRDNVSVVSCHPHAVWIDTAGQPVEWIDKADRWQNLIPGDLES